MAQGKQHKPTPQTINFVTCAVKAGYTVDQIADCMSMTDDTLRKHYMPIIKRARMELANKAIGVLDQHLEDKSLDAAKYTLSRVAGWTEKTMHSNDPDNPMPEQSVVIYQIPDNGRDKND